MDEWDRNTTYPYHIIETKVTQKVSLILRALVQVSIRDDGMGSVHCILLILHQQRKRSGNGALGSHKTLLDPMVRSVNNDLVCFWMNGGATGTFSWWLKVGRVLRLIGCMRGQCWQSPTLSPQCVSLFDLLLPNLFSLLVLWRIHLWNWRIS